MPRNCLNNPNRFCYICGRVTVKSNITHITPLVKKAYELYFECKVGDQDKKWAPHVSCKSCAVNLRGWLNGTHKAMPFAVPMVWREPKDHTSDCYFCLTNVSGITSKTNKSIIYPNIPSAIRPVPHSKELPVPVPPKNWSLDDLDECATSVDSEIEEDEDPDYTEKATEPQLISQSKLNDLIRDLHLSKSQAELLASRLQEWNLLEKNTKVTSYRVRGCEFVKFFDSHEALVFCTDVCGLMSALNVDYDMNDWRLFIDSSKFSLKAVLLHNGNSHPAIPVAYAVGMKETYGNMKLLLEKLKYAEHPWHICGDFKVLGLLLGMQSGYTKYCCFLCEWDSRAKDKHYNVKQWPARELLTPGQKSVSYEPLVEPQNVYLPPLHIKLGLMKIFVKALDKEGGGSVT